MLRDHLVGLSDDLVQRVTWRNAADLFRHDVPVTVQTDPNASERPCLCRELGEPSGDSGLSLCMSSRFPSAIAQ